MMMTAETFTSLLQSLGLVQGSFKPAPNVAVTSNATITSIHYAGSFHDADAALEGAQLFHEQQNATRPMTLHSSLGVVNDHSAAKNSRCTVTPYDPPPIADQVFRPFDSSMANVYRYRRQQSVNLGSW